jgi:hypothetical protein
LVTAVRVPEVFADGAALHDVRAALQAAWLADEDRTAIEIAQRYDLYRKICLRCAAWETNATINPTKVTIDAIGDFAYQMCLDCHYAESRGQLRHAIKVHVR